MEVEHLVDNLDYMEEVLRLVPLMGEADSNQHQHAQEGDTEEEVHSLVEVVQHRLGHELPVGEVLGSLAQFFSGRRREL